MGTIKLCGSKDTGATLVANRFLDEFMPNANGEFVKIYLYLLRASTASELDISISHIADIFNHTEKDVIRALKYWEQVHLLSLTYNADKSLDSIIIIPLETDYIAKEESDTVLPKITSIQHMYHAHAEEPDDTIMEKSAVTTKKAAATHTPKSVSLNQDAPLVMDSIESTIPDIEVPKFEKRSYSADELKAFKEQNDVIEFLYLAQKYIGKPLSGTDVNSLLYFYDVLEFDPELIEYLIEYCVTNGHKSLRYIEKVAISWAEDGINTVQLAKANTDLFSKNCYPVLKAFGLNGRNPGEGEKALIIKWTNAYGFTMDIILDACNRTMNTIHQPSFEYADSILTKWKERGIKTLSDVKTLDEQHQKVKAARAASKATADNDKKSDTSAKSKNSFNEFTQRSYNYETLEKELLGNI